MRTRPVSLLSASGGTALAAIGFISGVLLSSHAVLLASLLLLSVSLALESASMIKRRLQALPHRTSMQAAGYREPR